MPAPPGRTLAAAPVYQLSIDTGGTFTDGFVTSGDRAAQVKVDTTPEDPTEGFAACVAAAAGAMGESLPAFLARASVVQFSSTIATNIVVQRTGAQVGLVVTAGCERSLYGTPDDASRLAGFAHPEAIRGVDEATGPDGTVQRPVDPVSLETAVRELLEHGVALVVISFAGAHLNPANELAAKALIEASYPRHYLGAIPLVLSSQLSLHPDDHARTALAVANAYLHPVLARSLYKAEDRLRAGKFQHPLLVINTDGSSTRVAKTRAIDTYNSGPSAGVLGAAIVARALGAGHVVTFDVGGTTTDVAHIISATPPRSAATEFGGLALPHPAVALWSFGLGGGSVIAAEPAGGLTVGPRSAGAVPGPACFGLGGSDPTPTDVWLELGYLEPGEFLSGRRQLDPGPGRAALAALAAELGSSTEEAALTALGAVHAALAGHLRAWAAGQPELTGSDPARRSLFSYGGGGGLLAVPAAAALGIGEVVVFPQSSVFSAFGGSLLPVAHAYHAAVPDVSAAGAITQALAGVLDRAARDMRAEGVQVGSRVVAEVTLSDFTGQQASAAGSFQDLLSAPATAGVVLPGPGSRGRLSLSITAVSDVPLRPVELGRDAQLGATRKVRFADGVRDVPVSGGLGHPGAPPVPGPAFLAAPDTTVFVPAGWTAEFGALGYGIVRRQGDGG
ncbi:MAG TPA: hydantoinase/oxoprolinase family protein [Streptosporangiaceae bacterium]|nr:hydantoinase/oxoprolinase family protein [Streptosporangiaceae bacterium]